MNRLRIADCGLQIGARRGDDADAAEGYRVLSEDTRRFAEDALRTAAETWPEWDDDAGDDAAQPDAG